MPDEIANGPAQLLLHEFKPLIITIGEGGRWSGYFASSHSWTGMGDGEPAVVTFERNRGKTV